MGFPTNEQGGDCVAAIIASGIIPGGLEMMDRPAIHAAEDFCHPGYPLDVEALLICELDGPKVEVDHLINTVSAIARQHGAVGIKVSESEEERQRFWLGRKAAFPAIGRISPDYYCMDGTIPRKQLPHVLKRMAEMSEKYGLRVANVFHAGDGNLHPLIMYDANVPGELEKNRRVRRRDSENSASRSAACSPASTASAWKSAISCRPSSARTTSTSSSASNAPSTRARS